MSKIAQKLFGSFKPHQDKQPLTVSQLYHYKTRFATVGTVGSGKTSIAAAIVLTAQTLSSILPEFRCRVLQGNTKILSAASDLRRGRFPPKTPINMLNPPESGLLLSWSNFFGERKIQIPICDLAGEQLQKLLIPKLFKPDEETRLESDYVIKYAQDSDGFILAVPASRALIFDDDAKLELEPEDTEIDPDVNLSEILESVFQHKEDSNSKRIKGIAVVITKWDMLEPYAKRKDMNIYDPTGKGLQNFMNTAFPATMMTLKSYGLQNVKFFPSYIKVKRGSQGIERWEDGSPKIESHERYLRMPKYAEKSYVELFEYLKSFAT